MGGGRHRMSSAFDVLAAPTAKQKRGEGERNVQPPQGTDNLSHLTAGPEQPATPTEPRCIVRLVSSVATVLATCC